MKETKSEKKTPKQNKKSKRYDKKEKRDFALLAELHIGRKETNG